MIEVSVNRFSSTVASSLSRSDSSNPAALLRLANQNALYYQAEPKKIGASAGLLRTFMYLGAMVASSATGSVFGNRANTTGLHGLAIFMVSISAALFILTLIDRSLKNAAAAQARD